MPVIFRPNRPYPERADVGSGASLELHTLGQAQVEMLVHPDQWEDSANTIESVLKAFVGLPERPTDLDWQPAQYAAALSRVRLAHDDVAGARAAIELGFRIAPQDPQLLYLQRVLNRMYGKPQP